MRVLHLIDPVSPGGGGCTLHLLSETMHRLNTVPQRALVIGNRRHGDLARRCGVRLSGQINAPLEMAALSRGPARKLARLFAGSTDAFDIVHAWTAESALLALLAFPHNRKLATLSIGPMTGPATDLLATLLRRNPMPMIATSSGVLLEYETLGVDSEMLSILPPAVHPQSTQMRSRAELRQRWEVDDDTFVIGLLTEPVSWGDARRLVDIAARPRASGRRIRVVAHQRAFGRVEAERWVRGLGWDDFLIMDNELAEPWRIVHGLDMALVYGGEMNALDLRECGSPLALLLGGGRRLRPMPGIMPLLWAMAAQVPVVTEASDAVRDVVVDGENGLLIDKGDVVAAADRISRLYDDRSIARRLGAAGLETVQQRFDISAFTVRLKDTYEHVVQGLPPHVLGVDRRPWVARRQRETEAWTMR